MLMIKCSVEQINIEATDPPSVNDTGGSVAAVLISDICIYIIQHPQDYGYGRYTQQVLA